ncbi:MAG TPA: hypothetical protein VFH58_02985 [Acidimicrobiales bacterium]|nr:hypothetical protein [Acidimicrobiales bacterium]
MTASPETVEEAAARLEQIAPGYLDRIRRRAAELGLPRTPADGARRSIDIVVDSSRLNLDVPTASQRMAGRVVKRGVAVMVRFYLVFMAEQIRDLGESTSWMGTALYNYVAGLESEVAELRERVRCLEEARGPS